jgi:cysteinyl-tRNA synthetase
MHNGFVNIDDTKMSKSLGNFFLIREVLPRLRDPQVLRYFFLSSHYRGPINYSLEQLGQADAALGGLYMALRELAPSGGPAVRSLHREAFEAAMDDDFNTPEALAVLQGLAREINSARTAGEAQQAARLGAELRELGGVLGLLQLPPAEWFRKSDPAAGAAHGLPDAEVEARIAARLAARRAKNWGESDRIRDELAAAGVLLEDQPGGRSSWRRK